MNSAKVEQNPQQVAQHNAQQDDGAIVIPKINATVGMFEVDGLQIEMLSLAQLKEQTLAQEQALAEAKKAQKAAKLEARREARAVKAAEQAVDQDACTLDGKTAQRIRKARKVPLKTLEQAADSSSLTEVETATSENLNAAETHGEATLEPEKLTLQTAHMSIENSLLQPRESAGANNAGCTASAENDLKTANDNESSLETAPEQNLAQNLLNKLIADVEHRESQAAQIQDDAVAKDAAAAVLNSAQLTLNEQAAAHNIVDDPQWEDVEELSPEQLEKYSQMGLKEGDICPVCSNGILMLRHSLKSDFLGCSNFPECKFHLFTGKRSAVVTLKELSSLCPVCQGNLEVKKGRFGIFIGCSNYPSCDYVYHRKDEEPVVQIPCPVCKQGHLVERRSHSGKSFYGCNNYPGCNFSVFGKPVAEKCEECGFPVMYKRKMKKGIALICGDPLCPSRRRRKRQMFKSA